jgi:four helix bundle protein
MQHFTQLKVWERGHQLVLAIYKITARFPSDERFGLTSQLRRAAVSVPANVAEGSKRHTNQDFARFLNIAEASLAETEYLLLLARDLGYLEADAHKSLTNEASEISRMLFALRAKVDDGDRS